MSYVNDRLTTAIFHAEIAFTDPMLILQRERDTSMGVFKNGYLVDRLHYMGGATGENKPRSVKQKTH